MDGRTMLATTPEQLFRSKAEPLREGDRIDLDGLSVTVRSMFKERPTSIAVELDVPLEDPSLLFLIPTEKGFERYELPPIGHAAIVPAPQVPL
jgi:hypothetical protein